MIAGQCKTPTTQAIFNTGTAEPARYLQLSNPIDEFDEMPMPSNTIHLPIALTSHGSANNSQWEIAGRARIEVEVLLKIKIFTLPCNAIFHVTTRPHQLCQVELEA